MQLQLVKNREIMMELFSFYDIRLLEGKEKKNPKRRAVSSTGGGGTGNRLPEDASINASVAGTSTAGGGSGVDRTGDVIQSEESQIGFQVPQQ